jgi:hypothetical protein
MTARDKLQSAVRTLGLEIRIMSALAAYAEEAGSDNEIESWQAYRVSETFDELSELFGEPVKGE